MKTSLIFIFCFQDKTISQRTLKRRANNPLAGFCNKKQDGDYVHPFQCDKFIKCAHGGVNVIPCPANLYNNPLFRVCDVMCTGNSFIFILCFQDKVISYREKKSFVNQTENEPNFCFAWKSVGYCKSTNEHYTWMNYLLS